MIYKQIPQEMQHEYHKLNISFNDFNEFFDKYAKGKRQGNGIYSRYFGYYFDITIFWFTENEYPFAYVFPKSQNDNGYFFYINERILKEGK